jgi:hypothetical protein
MLPLPEGLAETASKLSNAKILFSGFLNWISKDADQDDRVRFRALPEKKVVGLERGPLSLVEYNWGATW